MIEQFLKPEELEEVIKQKFFKTVDVKGLNFNPLTNRWNNLIIFL